MLKCLPWGTEKSNLDYKMLDSIKLRLSSLADKVNKEVNIVKV